ncbi:arylsulfatase [Stieleria sp. JC731]|uniref:arylsulfatase n=1 Tax=Pirellulaceae TaxID=2691357 RepID=UPI001E2C7539|nr:arylsulfatase [Stieleria sp. JC731]MCC9601606.1 arylsulfatase [Stieleria sp. JC731]
MSRSKRKLARNDGTGPFTRIRFAAKRMAFATLTTFVCISAINLQQSASADDRPNILLIMCDDMGWSDIGCYGGEIETPNIDRLAKGGMRFRTFYNNAKCEHTRASLLTGRWWHHVGASATVHYAAETFGERMRDAGYQTLMTGKWHAGQTPFQRGFEHHYGLTDGCCNFWNPGHARPDEPEPAKKKVRRWADDSKEFTPFTPEGKDFYTTDAFTDKAIEYLTNGRDNDRPFLLYVAYTAPHYPMHASEEDVAKYRGKYAEIGWDRLRAERFERQKQIGILPAGATLSPRDPALPAWDEIPAGERELWDLRMATYAAMIDRMDRNIGKLLGTIDDIGAGDNTVVFFLSDNGACEDSADRSTVKGSMPWEVTSYMTQGRNWANASNTPFRKYKTTDYEGGTRTPMIAYWRNKIAPGTISDHVGHLVDFMPTMLDLANAEITEELPGHSLAPVLNGESVDRPWPIYWQFGKAKAIRNETFKLVQYAKGPWELYNLSEDPCELNDLSDQMPEQVRELKQQWETWWATKRK